MKKLKIWMLLMLSSFLLHAQTNYAVMVTDSKTGNPIAGASVKIRSTGKVVATSKSGNVVIFALPSDSLQIQFKGYKDREIKLEGQSAAIIIEMTLKSKVIAKPKKKRH